MSSYDPVSIHSTATDENGSSNAIINSSTNKTGVLVHKVVLALTGAGLSSAAFSVAINDHQTIGSSATLIFLKTTSGSAFAEDEYEGYLSETFDPPVPFAKGLSINVTGLATITCYIHYTRR